MMNLIMALAVLFLMFGCASSKKQACPKEDFLIYFMTPYGPFYTEIKEGEIDEYFINREKEEEEEKEKEMAIRGQDGQKDNCGF